MAPKCVLKKCMIGMHSTEEAKKAFYFRFPGDDPARFEKWCKALQKYIEIDYAALQTAQICSLHFDENDFCYADQICCLNFSAIPSKFKPDYEHDRQTEKSPKGCRNLAVVLRDIAPLINTRKINDELRVLEINCNEKVPQTSLNDEPLYTPNLNVPFCRLCLSTGLPLSYLFPPSDPGTGSQLVTLIQMVAGISVDFASDPNSAVCQACQQVLEDTHLMISSWQQNDALLTELRKQRLASPVEQMIQIEELVKNEPEMVEENGVAEAPPTVVVQIPVDRILELEARIAADLEAEVDTNADEELLVELPARQIDSSSGQDDSDDSDVEIVQGSETIDQPPPVIDLTQIDEKERLIRRAMRELRKSLPAVSSRKREKRKQKSTPKDRKKPYSLPPRLTNEL